MTPFLTVRDWYEYTYTTSLKYRSYLVVRQEGKNGLFEFLLGILNNAWYSIYYFRLYVIYIFSYFTGIVSSDSFVVLGYSVGMEK